MFSGQIELATDILLSYGGRDKVMRAISYGSLLVSGLIDSSSPDKSKKLLTISTQLSSCRIILRLFDDLPMLGYSLSYGLGTQEKSLWLRGLGLINNVFDQLFYPLEHIAWAADNNLIKTSSSRWWVLSIGAWAISLVLNILRSLTLIVAVRSKRRILEQHIQADEPSSQVPEGATLLKQREIVNLRRAERSHTLDVIKHASDLCNAVHWMPPGFLWGGKLSDTSVGVFGTISSLILLRSVVHQSRAKLAGDGERGKNSDKSN